MVNTHTYTFPTVYGILYTYKTQQKMKNKPSPGNYALTGCTYPIHYIPVTTRACCINILH